MGGAGFSSFIEDFCHKQALELEKSNIILLIFISRFLSDLVKILAPAEPAWGNIVSTNQKLIHSRFS